MADLPSGSTYLHVLYVKQYTIFKVQLTASFISHQKLKSLLISNHWWNQFFFFFCFGGHLLSHTVSSAVPSAAQVLTIVFGMGTGVSPERIATKKVEFLMNPHN